RQRVEAVLPDEGLRVRELVIARRRVRPVARPGERGRHLPARREREAHLGGTVELALFVKKEVRAEKFPERAREPGHREIDRVGEVIELDADPLAPGRRAATRAFVERAP